MQRFVEALLPRLTSAIIVGAGAYHVIESDVNHRNVRAERAQINERLSKQLSVENNTKDRQVIADFINAHAVHKNCCTQQAWKENVLSLASTYAKMQNRASDISKRRALLRSGLSTTRVSENDIMLMEYVNELEASRISLLHAFRSVYMICCEMHGEVNNAHGLLTCPIGSDEINIHATTLAGNWLSFNFLSGVLPMTIVSMCRHPGMPEWAERRCELAPFELCMELESKLSECMLTKTIMRRPSSPKAWPSELLKQGGMCDPETRGYVRFSDVHVPRGERGSVYIPTIEDVQFVADEVSKMVGQLEQHDTTISTQEAP